VPLAELSKKLSEIGEEVNVLALEGVASSDSRSSDFVRKDGSRGSLMQFDVTAEAGHDKTRVVIWDPGALPGVKSGQKLMVTNLRVKKTSGGERELHGDSGSAVRVAGSEPKPQVFTKVNQIKQALGPVNLEVMALSKVTVSEVSLREGGAAKKAELVIGDDTGEITIVGWREAVERMGEIDIGQKMRMLGVTRQVSRMGVEMLQFEAVSRIEKL
jgi:ssDNA-binding replication factor A large subunit